MPVAHVEAGLRSRDRSMPEEINRLLTDQLSDLLFTPSADGNDNLLHEGIDESRIHLVGNVMIDTLVRLLPEAEKRFPADVLWPYAPSLPESAVDEHFPRRIGPALHHADMADQVPPAVVRERYERLLTVAEEVARQVSIEAMKPELVVLGKGQ